MEQQIIMINDLLSFVSCKRKSYSKNILLDAVRNFYSKNVVSEAEKALSESLDLQDNPFKGDPLNSIFHYFEFFGTDQLPIFICRDINNTPSLKGLSKLPFMPTDHSTSKDLIEANQKLENVDDNILKVDQHDLKDQIKEITTSVNQLENILQCISKETSQSNSSFKKLETESTYGQLDSEFKFTSTESVSLEKMKRGVEYIQNLIDQQACEEALNANTVRENESEVENNEYEILELCNTDIESHASLQNKIDLNTTSEIIIDGSSHIVKNHKQRNWKAKSFIEFGEADESIHYIDGNSEMALYQKKRKKRKRKDSTSFEENLEVDSLFDPSKPLRCTYPNCNFATRHKSWLNVHLRKHTGEKPFCCPYCPFRSSQNGNVTVHIKNIHEIESGSENLWINSRHHCPYCRCRYWQKSNLNYHILKEHSNYKDLNHLSEEQLSVLCLETKKSDPETELKLQNILKSTIEASMNSISKDGDVKIGENGLRCWFPFCNFRTRHKSWLSVHLRKHTGEKPYPCPYCPFRASQGGNLNSHIKKIHNDVINNIPLKI